MDDETHPLTVRDDCVTNVTDSGYPLDIGSQRPGFPGPRTHTDNLPEVVYPVGFDEASDKVAESYKPVNTVTAYARDIERWYAYCAEIRLPTHYVGRGSLRAFVQWRWNQGCAPATIKRNLSGIAVTLRTDHVRIAKEDVTLARKFVDTLAGAAAKEGEPDRGNGKAPALPIDVLRTMVRALDLDTAAGLRDRLVLVLGFAIAARRHELAFLRVGDVTWVPEGLVVRVRVSKTGRRVVRVAYGSDRLTCPVRAWQDWMRHTGMVPVADASESLVRRVHRSGSVLGGMSAESVGEVVKRCAAAVGLVVPYTGHSLRAGLVTAARKAGKDQKAISETTGHVDGSAELMGYMRDLDGWDPANNATMGIGL